ncbi:MAG: tetratricopeptide repeat protein [Bacteroidota bacterium]
MYRLIIKITLSGLLLLLSGTAGYAQISRADSLARLFKSAKPDTALLYEYNEACIYLVRNNQHDTALYFSLIGIEYGKKYNFQRQLASSYNIAANCYYFKGLFAEATRDYLQALKIYEKLNYKKGIANCYNNLGNTYRRQNYFKEAIEYHNKALAIRIELNDEENLALSYNNIANIYHAQKKYPEALDNHFASLRIKNKLKDTVEIVLSLNNIGGLYTDLGKYDSAIFYHQKALVLNKLADNNIEDEEIAYVNLCRTYFKLGDYKTAEDYGTKALKLAIDIGDVETQLEANQLMSDIYKATKKYDKALQYYQSYVWLRDSVYNEENTAKLLAEQYQYNYDKKLEEERLTQARKDAIAQTEKKKQNQILILVSSILLLVIVFSVFIYRNYSKNKQINHKNNLQTTIIREKQKEIIDSINYAKRIQDAVFPDDEQFVKVFDDALVYNNPKDIVSGDLYWYAELSTTAVDPVQLKVLAVADCTGHGVPGGFMSLLAIQLLNQSVKNPQINSPAELLTFINSRITQDLNKNNKGRINDGLDIAFCAIDYKNNVVYFSGANRPLWIMSGNTIREIIPTRASIGGFTDETQVFENHSLQLSKGDRLYLFTDGITDQFGSAANKKFSKKRLKEFLLETSALNMQKQGELFAETMKKWQGNNEQTDDMMMLGIQL